MKLFTRFAAALSLGLLLSVFAPRANAIDSPVCNAGTSLCDQGTAYLNALKEADAYSCYTTTGMLAQRNTHRSQAVLLPADPNRYEPRAECYREWDHSYAVYLLSTNYFPAAATCSARPALTVVPDSGPVCHQGCAYQAAAGQSTATPTGATCVPTAQQPIDPGKNCNNCDSVVGNVAVGDPVNMFTGVESESVNDFQAPDGHLSLVRYYSSSPDLPQLPGLGGAWRHSYLRAIQIVDAATVRSVRADGSNYLFRKTSSGWVPDWDVSERLIETVANGATSGWVFIANDDSRETYDASGRLTEISHLDADKLALIYAANKLQSVTDRKGRKLIFAYVGSSLGRADAHTSTTQFGRAKLASSQNPCPDCGGVSSETRTYDAAGYPDIAIDLNGSKTDTDYNSRGLLTQTIEAVTDAAGNRRTTQTDWHPLFAKPIERRVYDAAWTLVAKSRWTYNDRGKVVTQSTDDLSP